MIVCSSAGSHCSSTHSSSYSRVVVFLVSAQSSSILRSQSQLIITSGFLFIDFSKVTLFDVKGGLMFELLCSMIMYVSLYGLPSENKVF